MTYHKSIKMIGAENMLDWLKHNWTSVLGTGGIGVIIVAIINLIPKKKMSSGVEQKIISKKRSTNYQSGRDININQEDRNIDK